MHALVLQGRARRLLAREGDDLRLLDAVALNATTAGRWADAAQIAGPVDAALLLAAKALQLQAGAALSRDRAFAPAFGE